MPVWKVWKSMELDLTIFQALNSMEIHKKVLKLCQKVWNFTFQSVRVRVKVMIRKKVSDRQRSWSWRKQFQRYSVVLKLIFGIIIGLEKCACWYGKGMEKVWNFIVAKVWEPCRNVLFDPFRVLPWHRRNAALWLAEFRLAEFKLWRHNRDGFPPIFSRNCHGRPGRFEALPSKNRRESFNLDRFILNNHPIGECRWIPIFHDFPRFPGCLQTLLI